MTAVMIGAGPHKGSHTVVGISAGEHLLGKIRVRACPAQAEQLVAWAREWPLPSVGANSRCSAPSSRWGRAWRLLTFGDATLVWRSDCANDRAVGDVQEAASHADPRTT